MALLLPSDTALPALSPKPPRGWRYGHRQSRPIVEKFPDVQYARHFHERRHFRDTFQGGLAAYWKHTGPPTPALYAAYAAALGHYLTLQGKYVYPVTPFQAFLIMNIPAFHAFLQGTYNPRTDLPPSEAMSDLWTPRPTWSFAFYTTWGGIPIIEGFDLAQKQQRPYPATIYANPPGIDVAHTTNFARMFTASANCPDIGTDSTDGHWPLANLFDDYPFPVPTQKTAILIKPSNGIVADSHAILKPSAWIGGAFLLDFPP